MAEVLSPPIASGSSAFSGLMPRLTLARTSSRAEDSSSPPSLGRGLDDASTTSGLVGTPISVTPLPSSSDSGWRATLGMARRSERPSITIVGTGVIEGKKGILLRHTRAESKPDGPQSDLSRAPPSTAVSTSSSSTSDHADPPAATSQDLNRTGSRERSIKFAPLPTTYRGRAYTTGKNLWLEADEERDGALAGFHVVLRDDEGRVVNVDSSANASAVPATVSNTPAASAPLRHQASAESITPNVKSESRSKKLLGPLARPLGFRRSKGSGTPLTRSNSLNDAVSSFVGTASLSMRRTRSKDSTDAGFDNRKVVYPPVAQRRAMAGVGGTRSTYSGPEPAFVEWGASRGASPSRRDGAKEQDHDEQDGSGMAWLNKRRREREAKEQEEAESRPADATSDVDGAGASVADEKRASSPVINGDAHRPASPASVSTPTQNSGSFRIPTPESPSNKTGTADSTPEGTLEGDEAEEDDEEASREESRSGCDEELDDDEMREEERLQAQAKSGQGVVAAAAGKEVYHDHDHHRMVMQTGADADDTARDNSSRKPTIRRVSVGAVH